MTKVFWSLAISIALIVYLMRDKIVEELPAVSPVRYDPDKPYYSRKDVRIAIRKQASAGGYPPEWFDAIAKTESNWQLDALNDTGSDGKYGGAWGPMQMLQSTASRLGFDVNDISSDPDIAGQAAVAYFADARPKTFDDACAYWNSGRKSAANVPASTVEYIAKANDNLAWVTENPPS